MKVMSLNGWGGKLHRSLTRYLGDEAPDILCLQEVVHSPKADHDWLEYRDGDQVLAQRANGFSDVCEVLPDHTAILCPAARGVLWRGSKPIPSFWGLATFVHKSLPIIAQAQGFVHKTFSPDGYGDHPRSRNAHAVRLYDTVRNRPISVTHMHGLRDLAGKMDTPERREQVQRLLALHQQVSEPGDAAIICGDFNVEPDSETLEFLEQHGFRNLIRDGGFESTRSSHYKKPSRFADYMLVNGHTEVVEFRVVYEPEVSDHCPLLLEV